MTTDIFKLGLDFRGTVTLPPDATHPTARKVVFQGASHQTANYWTKTGQPRKIRAHVVPLDPKTAPQLARRAHMRAGVLIWQAMTTEQKAQWRKIAEQRGITGYNAFCSHWLKQYQPPNAAMWDAENAAWDNGAASWDNGAATWEKLPPATWDGGAATWDNQ